MKMDNGRLIFALHKNWSGVARPAAIGRMRDEADFSQIHTDVFKNMPRVRFVFFVPHDEIDFFARRNFPHHFTINPRDDFKFSRPVVGVVRPAEPRRFVLVPFGGKSKAEFGRSRGGGIYFGRHKLRAEHNRFGDLGKSETRSGGGAGKLVISCAKNNLRKTNYLLDEFSYWTKLGCKH